MSSSLNFTVDGANRLVISDSDIYLSGIGSNGFSGSPMISPNSSVGDLRRVSSTVFSFRNSSNTLLTIPIWPSDLNMKTNVAPSTFDSLQLVEDLDFIEFDWKPEYNVGDHQNLGISAQQLQELDPDSVITQEDGHLSPNLPNLMAHNAKAVQQLSDLVQQLTSKIDDLKAKVAQDKITIQELEEQIE